MRVCVCEQMRPPVFSLVNLSTYPVYNGEGNLAFSTDSPRSYDRWALVGVLALSHNSQNGRNGFRFSWNLGLTN